LNITVEKEFKGHVGTVWSVNFSPDGKKLATSGEDHTIKIWDIEKGVLLHSLPGHRLNIWKVRFTPDGNKVVSSSFDDLIRIWDVKKGILLTTLEGHQQAVVGLDISPNGKVIASASDDKTIKLWDLESGKELRTLHGGEEHVYAVAFSPDSKTLISSNRDRSFIGEGIQNFFGNYFYKKNGVTMRLWDVPTGALLQTFTGHEDDVMDVAMSADGAWIASASDDKTVRLWRLVQ
jgi:WD40 repeat protein